MAKTTIIQKTATGYVCFKAEMPEHLTRREVRKLCRKWRVQLKGLIVQYS